MVDINKILKTAEVFEKLAKYGDRKSFLEALAQEDSGLKDSGFEDVKTVFDPNNPNPQTFPAPQNMLESKPVEISSMKPSPYKANPLVNAFVEQFKKLNAPTYNSSPTEMQKDVDKLNELDSKLSIEQVPQVIQDMKISVPALVKKVQTKNQNTWTQP